MNMKIICFLVLIIITLESHATNSCEIDLNKQIDITGDGTPENIQVTITSGDCADADISFFIDKKDEGRIFQHINPLRYTGFYSIEFGGKHEVAQAHSLAKYIFNQLTQLHDLPEYTNDCETNVIVSKEYYLKLRKQKVKVFSYFIAEGGETHGFVPELNQVIQIMRYSLC